MGPIRNRAFLGVIAAGALVAGAVVLIFGSLIGESASESGKSAGAPLAEAVDLLPSETLRDWASYADQLSVVTATSEEELSPPPGADPRLDEDYVGRRVTLHIDRTLWRREGAPSSDDTIGMVVWGWAERNGQRRPFEVRGGARMEVGHRYLLPMTKIGDEWTPLASGTILTLSADTVTSEVPGGRPDRVAGMLRGRRVAEVGAMLSATSPDPAAERYADLPPRARWRAASGTDGS